MADAVAPEYLSRVQAAERCRVAVSTFDRLRREGKIPLPDAEVGRHVIWRAETIDRFLEAGGTRANERQPA